MKVGDLVDCYDNTDCWYASQVVGIEDREFKKEVIPMV